MKFSRSVLYALLPAAVSAFAPSSFKHGRVNTGFNTVLQAAGAAATKEDDIALTLAVIMAHNKQMNSALSATEGVEESTSMAVKEEDVAVTMAIIDKLGDDMDMSSLYDAAVGLSYIASDFNSMALDEFEKKHLGSAMDFIKSKQVEEEEEEEEEVDPDMETGDITEEEIRALFGLWNDALATGDSDKVAQRYSSDAVLLPTVSDDPRTDYDSIKDYFDAFLLKEPQGEILEGHITIGEDWANDSGIYEFTMGSTGGKVKARYTYHYVIEDDEWKIQHHHSSVMPEEVHMASMQPITEDEVKGLFSLWNDALATLDPKKVADRYAKNSVLLPTVSDVPRTDYAAIEDYFTNFLKLEPQGEILESNVVIGLNWAQDCGIYEFTMGATGKKVKGRYSYIYVYEDGEWKISHHHSSIMPEGIVSGEPITEDEVRSLFGLWNDALASKDPEQVANRYSKQSVLLPTVSDVPRTDYPGKVDYFTNFLKLEPQGEILSGDIIIGTNWAQDAGIYEFTMGATGAKVKGRYTYVYVFEDGEWKISQHHSSVMPEEGKPEAITEDEVKALFNLWNDALATEDPDTVAKRYATNAVLLPTVSDVPRTDYDLIKDYFVSFLQKKPQGEILESNVTIGHNWCQDAGIYEFTMGATGDKVKGRYSFVYVFEDGEWKISHHHSSVMPEGILGESPKPEPVEA